MFFFYDFTVTAQELLFIVYFLSCHRKLSVVVDVSCDITSPNNPLPFCDSITTFEHPSRRLQLRLVIRDYHSVIYRLIFCVFS